MIPITTSFIICSIIQLFCYCFNKPLGSIFLQPKSANCSLLRLIYRFSQLWNSGTQPPKAVTLEGTNISQGIFEDDFPLVWMGYVRSQEGTHLHMDISKNTGTPKSSHFNRVFHYKPSILGYHYFWKHPYSHSSSSHFSSLGKFSPRINQNRLLWNVNDLP